MTSSIVAFRRRSWRYDVAHIDVCVDGCIVVIELESRHIGTRRRQLYNALREIGDVIDDGSMRAVYICAFTLARRPFRAVSCISIHHPCFDKLSCRRTYRRLSRPLTLHSAPPSTHVANGSARLLVGTPCCGCSGRMHPYGCVVVGRQRLMQSSTIPSHGTQCSHEPAGRP